MTPATSCVRRGYRFEEELWKHLHLKQQSLDLAQSRRISGHYSIVSNQTSSACADIRYGCEQDKGVGDSPESFEKPECDEDEEDAHQAERGTKPLDMLDGVALCICEIHIASLAMFELEEAHGGEGKEG